MNDGTNEIKYISYEPIYVTADNMKDIVLKDGFYTVEQNYANVPKVSDLNKKAENNNYSNR
jgi:hypothetical protein